VIVKKSGISDLTASTASDAFPHSQTIAKKHLPCSYSNLDNLSSFENFSPNLNIKVFEVTYYQKSAGFYFYN